MNPYSGKPGGTSTYVAHLMENLEKAGHKIKLISTPLNEPNEKYDRLDKIPIKIWKDTGIHFLIKLLVKTPGMKIPRDSIIQTHRPDFMFPFIIFFRKNPKVCTLHGIPNIGIKTRKSRGTWRIYSMLERFSLKRIQQFIAVDERTRDFYEDLQPSLNGRIKVIPVGIDPELFRPLDKQKMREKYGFAQDEKIILYVGRFSVEKGLDLLLKSFKEVNEKDPKTKLVLLGDGLEEDKLKEMVKDLAIRNVTFMQPAAHDVIPEIMNCADVFALSSFQEGLPTVVLEALACGKPVVATDVGDVRKVVKDGETGYLVKDRNVQEFVKGLIKVIDNVEIDYVKNCQNMANRYSWARIVDEIISVYKQLDSTK
jgi:glycosyltransferase involved in cell wall biosynthesis